MAAATPGRSRSDRPHRTGAAPDSFRRRRGPQGTVAGGQTDRCGWIAGPSGRPGRFGAVSLRQRAVAIDPASAPNPSETMPSRSAGGRRPARTARAPDAIERTGGRDADLRVATPFRRPVALVGTFTDWKERPLAMTGPDARGAYSTTIVLDPGSHEYKFLIDGETFRHDPGNPESAGFFHNSLVRLP